MSRNSRDEVFDRRMKTNIYDDASLEEIRGRVRRIHGHRTSSLSDIKDFQASVDVSSLKGKDNSTILISESTLLELKRKVDESETQRHFMNALKERLKETNHEKDVLLKKSHADTETLRRKNEEIELLKEEIGRLNGNIAELRELLESSKQRIVELESSNDGNNIMTGIDMQSRIDSMTDCNFKSKEVKTLQDELLLNEDLPSNGSGALGKQGTKSSIRHVLFNDKTEQFVGDLKVGTNNVGRSFDELEGGASGEFVRSSNERTQCGGGGQQSEFASAGHEDGQSLVSSRRDWMKMMVRLSGFICFKSKMVLIRQYLEDEEAELLSEVVLENICGSGSGKTGKKYSSIGYSGPSENKIKMVFSPLKTELNETIYRLERGGEGEDEERVYAEKKRLLSKLDEQIASLKEKIDAASSVSGKTSGNSSRVMSFSDITTEKDSMDSIPAINSSRSSKFSGRLKSNSDAIFIVNRRLLYIFVRLKLWIMEEMLYDELFLDGSVSSRDGSDLDSLKHAADYFENAYDFIINIDNDTTYYMNNHHEYLSVGIVQMLYILNKQWERSIANESRLLNQLQEMVRIYHRIKSYLLAPKKSSCQPSSGNPRAEHGSTLDSGAESLQLLNENNYVLQVEKELTSLGLGIFSGRDLNHMNKRRGSRHSSSELPDSDIPPSPDCNSKATNHEHGNAESLLSREQVNEILRHLEDFPDPFIANRNEILAIRELIRPLKSYGRRAPEPYIGFFAMMTQRLDNDIVQHDREIRAFQKVIKGLEDQCDRQQEELEELHEELEQLYDIIENSCEQPKDAEPGGNDGPGDGEKDCLRSANETTEPPESPPPETGPSADSQEKTERKLTSQLSEKEWISLCKQTSLGLSDEQ